MVSPMPSTGISHPLMPCSSCSFSGGGDANPDEVDKALSILTTCLDYYERVLDTRDYLAGDEFPLVDIYVMSWIPWLHAVGLDALLRSRPGVEAWWKRVTSESSFLAAYSRYTAEELTRSDLSGHHGNNRPEGLS
ncbi:hypothetical protein PVAG01_08861 [Phlyctema vagabunda]|uniref:GST C-terminal domain-containing protein n=1 Tax=Phlyctema vagabunda TaxID=108571 RepID=A0ABR4PAL8_9HELO